MGGRILPVLRSILTLVLITARSDVAAAGDENGEMVAIPAGSFLMGATTEEQQTVLSFGWRGPMRDRIHFLIGHSGPQHTIHLDAFYIDTHEVTNQAYRAFVEATGHSAPTFWTGPRQLADPTQPVVGVSWYDAQAFCVWQGKRLPSEAE